VTVSCGSAKRTEDNAFGATVAAEDFAYISDVVVQLTKGSSFAGRFDTGEWHVA